MKTTNPAIALAVLAAVALSAPRASAVTPDKFVRYVEATGSQWVDTGVVGRHGIKAECKVEWMALADTAFLACGYWSANTRFYACWCSTASGNMFTAQRTGDKVNYNSQDLLFEKKRVYTYATDFSAADGNNMSTNTVSIDGTKVFSKTYTALDTGLNLYVFANNQNGTAAVFSKTRCYGLKIWQDGTLVRDFRPCVHGGRAGLYDAKNDRIYYSASGTDLTYDTNCDVPDAFIDYVESFGNSYVDTKVTGRSGTAAKMELVLMGNSDQALLASRDGNNRFYPIHNGGGSQWLYGYGGYTKFGSFEVGKKYFVDSSLAAGSQVIKIGEDGPDGATTTYIDATSATSIDTGRSMYLFCCNQSGSALAKQYWGQARVYWLQIFQDGDLVRDFRPCLKYGQAALYDDVSKTIFYPEGDPLGYDNSVAADPKKLVFVDYIESDGFTHLDTRVYAESATRATGEMAWMQVRTSDQEKQYFCDLYRSYLACGCYNSGSDANRFYMVTETSQKPWIGYGNNSQSFGSAFVEGQKYSFDVSFAAGAQSFALTPDGGTMTTTSKAWSGEATGYGNLYLFACNDAKNGKPMYRSAARCYGLTIYQNGDDANPVRDFKPCVLDGQAALYDTVSGRVFYPVPAIPAAGNTGAILPESANSEPEVFLKWVETDGTQFVDIGVVGRAGTTAEFLETSLCDNQNNEECFLGSVTADWQTDRFYMWYHRTRFALGLGYAGEFWTPSLADPTAKVSDWNPATNPDAYPLPNGAQTHARVSFAAGSQRVLAATNATDALKLVSSRTIADDIDTGCNLYLFARNNNGTPDAFAKSRLYWLRIWQDGVRVRRCQPVRLKNGLVALWDSVGKKAYLPTTAEGGFAAFSAVGPETDELVTPPLVLVVR